jgi:hypothetical protein
MVPSKQGLRRLEKEWRPHVDSRQMYAFFGSSLIRALMISSGLWEERPSVRNTLVIHRTVTYMCP